MEAVGRISSVVGWHAHAYRRMWRGSITVSFLNPIFFLVSIGILLGTLVDQSDPDLGGLSYLEFVAPALVAVTAMQTAASVTTFPVKMGLKWVRTYHAVVATPVRVRELVAGVLVWAGVRVTIACGLFVIVAAIAGAFTSPLAALAPVAGLLCGLAFAAGLAAVTSGTDADQWLVAIFRFVLVPLFLFSGTFFPIEQLPDWIEPLAWATPLWHGVELSRSLATGDVDAAPAALNVAYLVTFTVVGAVIATRACARKLGR
jgi:lipooligosaccharide transport system permease protein